MIEPIDPLMGNSYIIAGFKRDYLHIVEMVPGTWITDDAIDRHIYVSEPEVVNFDT